MNSLGHLKINGKTRQRQTGLSLIELMISITIGLLLVAGVTALISQQSSNRSELDKSGRQIENGRYALTLLEDDIQHAGFYGQYGLALPALAAFPDPCSLVLADIDASLAMPLQGYASPTTVPSPLSACLSDANHLTGTDILVVRRLEADDVLPTIATAVAGQVYVQATPVAKVTASGTNTAPFTLTRKDGVTPAELRKYVEHIYFISPCNAFAPGATACSASADGGKPVPTLKRLELTTVGNATAFTIVPLVDGIENMHFDYGVDTVGMGTPSLPFVNVPGIVGWPNVMEVQVNLLARNVDKTAGYTDGRKFNLGVSGSVGPFTDNYKRHVYTANVRATNPGGRRE